MKKLQNNYTTPEQSKRLLELGVPADSADMYYQNALPEPKVIPVGRMYQEYTDSIEGVMRHIWFYTPCWSVGRLIEIMKICAKPKEQAIMAEEMLYCTDLVELLVYMIEANKQIMDFSKLE
jgi:hypothetical protein